MEDNSKRFFHRREGTKTVTLKKIPTLSLNDNNNPLSDSLPPVVEKSSRPFFNQKFLIILSVFLLILGGYLGERYFVRGKVKLPFIAFSPHQKETSSSDQSLTGRVIVGNSIVIESNLRGKVTKILVKSGEAVKEGQKLAEISPDEQNPDRDRAYQRYLTAKNNLEKAKEELQVKQENFLTKHRKFMEDAVARNLPESDPIYQAEKTEMDQAEAEFKKQQAIVSQKQKIVDETFKEYQQGFTVLISPVTGTISELNLILGEAVPSRAAVIRTEKKTEIAFPLPVDKAAMIIAETPVEVVFADGTKQAGKVLRVDENGQMIVGLNEETMATFLNMPVETRLPL